MEYKLDRLPSMRNGYYMVHVPKGYPADSWYAPEHRVIYWLHHGELPPKGWHIHHINGDPTDNRVENLEALLASDHIKMPGHAADLDPAEMVALLCKQCETEYQYLKSRVTSAEKLGQENFFCGKHCQIIYQNQFKKGCKNNYPKERKSSGRKGADLICQACHKEYYVPKYKELTSKTCSLACSYVYKSMTRTGIPVPERVNKTKYLDLECAQCKKEFKRSEREVTKSIKAGAIRCFCSSACIVKFNNDERTTKLALERKLD